MAREMTATHTHDWSDRRSPPTHSKQTHNKLNSAHAHLTQLMSDLWRLRTQPANIIRCRWHSNFSNVLSVFIHLHDVVVVIAVVVSHTRPHSHSHSLRCCIIIVDTLIAYISLFRSVEKIVHHILTYTQHYPFPNKLQNRKSQFYVDENDSPNAILPLYSL
jgi:hypothetical protein